VRVSSDVRLIVHKSSESLLLCYVAHHDKAYQWAERRKLEIHPKTGAAQLVEIRETVREILVPHYVQEEVPAVTDRRYRKPHIRWNSRQSTPGLRCAGRVVDDVRQATEDTLLALADHLPAEAAEGRCLNWRPWKTGSGHARTGRADPFAHPDAQRRFRVMNDIEELKRALEYPWEKWTVFLHPAQRQLVERTTAVPREFPAPRETGKTIVALHRAVFLARTNPDARILLTTFSDNLANALRTKLRRLVSNEPRLADRLDVYSLDAIGHRLYKSHSGEPRIATKEHIRELFAEASTAVGGHKFTPAILAERVGKNVVDAWQLDTWEAYRDVRRSGERHAFRNSKRCHSLVDLDRVRVQLAADKLITSSGVFTKLAVVLAEGKRRPFDFAVVDEAQDIGVAHLRFFATLGGNRPNGLFFAGDLGQRIFQQPFSWRALGVDIRGRSRTLHVNYRTSHQIRAQADRYWVQKYRTSMAIPRSGAAPSPCSMGRPRPFASVTAKKTKPKTVAKWDVSSRNRRRVASRVWSFRPF